MIIYYYRQNIQKVLNRGESYNKHRLSRIAVSLANWLNT